MEKEHKLIDSLPILNGRLADPAMTFPPRFIEPGREEFMASEEIQDAVIRNVEVIGYAAKQFQCPPGSRLRLSTGRQSAVFEAS